ncbi:MAG: DUF1700 domain-containing protein [Candidatus Merdivicinus sp.]|jgi:uncharacterized membrane protein
MTRNEYLEALRKGLSSLPFQEQEDALQYYTEYFDDAGVEQEQQVIAELGSPEELARNIIQNSMFSLTRNSEESEESSEKTGRQWKAFERAEKSASAVKNSNQALFWALVILSSIIWIPLLFGVIVTVLSILIGAIALLGGLGIAALAMLAASIFCIGAGFPLLAVSPVDALLLFGLALMYLAGVVLFVVLCIASVKLVMWCWKQTTRFFRFLGRKMHDFLK